MDVDLGLAAERHFAGQASDTEAGTPAPSTSIPRMSAEELSRTIDSFRTLIDGAVEKPKSVNAPRMVSEVEQSLYEKFIEDTEPAGSDRRRIVEQKKLTAAGARLISQYLETLKEGLLKQVEATKQLTCVSADKPFSTGGSHDTHDHFLGYDEYNQRSSTARRQNGSTTSLITKGLEREMKEQNALKSPEAYTQPFCDFLTKNPTIWHTVQYFEKKLDAAGFKKVYFFPSFLRVLI